MQGMPFLFASWAQQILPTYNMLLQWFLTAALAAWSVHAQSSSCPGYTASNVQATDSGLTAQLSLAGEACNTYGTDLQNLTLLVEYQTGTLSR
jgi:alpha-glucosidase